MIQLQPKEFFTVVRQIADPTDETTYYVRAVIRKSSDDSILATLDLTDNGSQRFTGDWQVVEDSSNEGFLIDITTTVYTDSGYTTKSENYTIENNTYLVQQRWNSFLGGGGGGGGLDITKNQLKEIIKGEIEKIKMPEMKETDLSNISKDLEFIVKSFKELKIPEPEKVDYTSIFKTLNRVSEEIKTKIDNIPAPEKLDLNPIIEANREENNKLAKDLKVMADYLINMFKGNSKRVEDFIKEANNRFDISDKLRGVFNGVKGDVKPFPQEEKQKRERIRAK